MNTKINSTVVAFRDRTVVPAHLLFARDLGDGALTVGDCSNGMQTTHPFLGKASPNFRAS